MKIQFLGTGAADFHECLYDERRYTLDKNIRRCNVTLLDETYLIDCGPHLMDEIKLHGVQAQRIEHVLLTHDHDDHYDIEQLALLRAAAGHDLHLWYGEITQLPQLEGFIMHPMKLFMAYDVGSLSVTALPANHSAGAVHYSIEGDKSLFYNCDGSWLLMDTYYAMHKKHYDMMIMDATVGDYDGDYRMAEHNSVPMIRTMLKSFHTFEIADDHTVIVLDHLARTLHKPHDEICEQVKPDGFVVAYDGLTMEI